MKQCLSFFLIFCWSFLAGQEFTDNHFSNTLEEKSQKLDSLIEEGKDSSALHLIDELISHFNSENKSKADPIGRIKYYNLLIARHELLNDLSLIKADSIDKIISLEAELKEEIPESQLSLAKHYSSIAQIYKKVTKDRKLTISFLKKSLAQYELVKENVVYKKVGVLNRLGSEHRMIADLTNSKMYYDTAIGLNKKQSLKDTMNLINSYYGIGVVSYYSSKYKDGFEQALMAVSLAEAVLDRQDELLIKIYRLVSIMYSTQGELRSSLEYALKALQGKKDESGEGKKGIAGYYNSVSSSYAKLGEKTISENYIDSAIVYAIRDKADSELAIYYHDKALLVRDGEKAISLIKKAIDICKDGQSCSDAAYSVMLQNLGNEYVTSGNLQQGLIYVSKAQRIKENNYERLGVYLPSTYGSLALIKEYSDDLQGAIVYQELALKTVKEFRPARSHFVAVELSRLGKYKMQNGELEKAKELLELAHSIFSETVDKYNYHASLATRSLAELYNKKNNNTKALDFAYLSLAAAENSQEKTQGQLKLLFEIHYKEGSRDSCQYYLSKLLKGSGNTIVGESDEFSRLNKWDNFSSYYTYLVLEERLKGNEQTEVNKKVKAGIKLLDEFKPSNFFEVSESDFQQQTRSFFDWSINRLSKQYAVTQDELDLALMFECIEKSKSIIINRNFVRQDFLWEGIIPTDLVAEEKRILQDFNIAYDKYKTTEEGDSLKLVYADEMFDLEKERESYLLKLQSDYPDYYGNRYEYKLCSLSELKKQAVDLEKSILVMYASDSLVHLFLTSPEKLHYKSVQTKILTDDLKAVTAILSQTGKLSNENSFSSNKTLFSECAARLYSNIFHELVEGQLTKELVIIPDGPFVKFPFEVLLTEKIQDQKDYRDFPYLLKEHVVSYLSSATQLNNYRYKRKKKNKQNYGGFGPVYKPKAGDKNDHDSGLRTDHDPLLYNVDEIRNSATYFGGDTYLAENATKNNFIMNSGNYNILHLAMHANLNDNQPMESYLDFTPVDSSYSESQLYVHEIAKMNLSANLVVLSACKTNNGNQNSGDGILGIAKAFKLASCDNLVLSNWLVDDKSSSTIISSFFNNLSNDLLPAKALRAAKLDFLLNSNTVQSHPKYWAAFSYYGSSDDPIVKSMKSNSLYFLLGFGFFIILALAFLKLR